MSIGILFNDHCNERFDWIQTNRYFKEFKYPPKINHENLESFLDGLKTVIPQKLERALKRKQQLKRKRIKRLELISKKISKRKQFVWYELEAAFFSEFYIITVWVKYWLLLWDYITASHQKKESIHYFRKITDLDIKKAKDHPIANLYDGKLRKSGDRLVGLCPLHSEKTPSFFIYPNNSWYCFGACQTGGDSINFAMRIQNLDFIKTVRHLTYGHN